MGLFSSKPATKRPTLSSPYHEQRRFIEGLVHIEQHSTEDLQAAVAILDPIVDHARAHHPSEVIDAMLVTRFLKDIQEVLQSREIAAMEAADRE